MIDTDASGDCLGGVLQQTQDTFEAYRFRITTNDTYGTKVFCAGTRNAILVRTDHESLKYFLTQKNLGRRLARFVDDIAH